MKLSALTVPPPPAAEQHRRVTEVERRLSLVAEVDAQVDASLKRRDRLGQAILSTAFEGNFLCKEVPRIFEGNTKEYAA